MTFFIERLEVMGEGLEPAVLELRDGLNVVAGASDTGKSYVVSLIDYAFGASTSPRAIEAAAGYGSVRLTIRERADGERHQIQRAFGSPRATLVTLAEDGTVSRTSSVSASHAAGAETLSSFLLRLSGFDLAWRVRKNSRGDYRSISYRDVAYLTVVHEARIIAERPPFLSENPIENTPRTDVLRLMVTGDPPATTTELATLTRRADPGGQLDLLRALIAETEAEIGGVDRTPESLEARRERAETLRARAFAAYAAASQELLEQESMRSDEFAKIRELEAKTAVASGLEARFDLLTEHYRSDIERLKAMAEASELLTSLPMDICPTCGSDRECHRPERVAAQYEMGSVRAAADAEVIKTERLQAELNVVLTGIAADRVRDANNLERARAAVVQIERAIEQRLSPVFRSSSEDLRVAEIERDEVTRIELLVDRLSSLQERAAVLEPPATPAEPAAAAPQTLGDDLEPMLREVGALLGAWNMPGAHAVAFSNRSKDLVIDGEDRESHGKGVRALTCAAFILGILKNATARDRPHPGLVVLDSPLVAYREPDADLGQAGELVAAGVNDAFYGSLARGLTGGQVLIFENEEPAADLAGMNYVHFSKTSAGRYGFFPPRVA